MNAHAADVSFKVKLLKRLLKTCVATEKIYNLNRCTRSLIDYMAILNINYLYSSKQSSIVK